MPNSYLPLNEYRRQWMFNHHQLLVPEDVKATIRPLAPASAMVLWNKYISNKSSCAEDFSKGDWAARSSAWQQTELWQLAWDADTAELPESVLQFMPWPDDTPVYFCIEKYDVIETCWAHFKQHWKCFLFYDDGPMLISPQQRQVLWFSQAGTVQMGIRG